MLCTYRVVVGFNDNDEPLTITVVGFERADEVYSAYHKRRQQQKDDPKTSKRPSSIAHVALIDADGSIIYSCGDE
jgi:hypothetical protein